MLTQQLLYLLFAIPFDEYPECLFIIHSRTNLSKLSKGKFIISDKLSLSNFGDIFDIKDENEI